MSGIIARIFTSDYLVGVVDYLQIHIIRYGDSVDNTVEENSSVFSLIRNAGCRQQGHVGSKTLHQQNPPVLNCRCWLTQVDL